MPHYAPYSLNDAISVTKYITSPQGRHLRILEAIDILKAAVHHHPDDFVLHHLLAVHCSKGFAHEDNDELAEESFNRAFELNPNDHKNFMEYQRFLSKKQRYSEAELLCLEWLEGAEEDSLEEAIGYEKLGYLYLDMSKFEDNEEARQQLLSWARGSVGMAEDIAPDSEYVQKLWDKVLEYTSLDASDEDIDALHHRLTSLQEEAQADNALDNPEADPNSSMA